MKMQVTIDKTGKVEVEVLDGQGSGCQSQTEGFLERLGGEQTTVLKDEYYQRPQETRIETGY